MDALELPPDTGAKPLKPLIAVVRSLTESTQSIVLIEASMRIQLVDELCGQAELGKRFAAISLTTVWHWQALGSLFGSLTAPSNRQSVP
jgi:hypothetical protein